MNRYPTPETLAAYWQHVVEINNEAGRRPLISLGMQAFQAEHVLRSLALQQLARRPLGLIGPLFIVGGEGGRWLLTAMQWQEWGGQPDGFAVTYAGRDLATYAAVLNIHAPLSPDPGGPFLPPGMAWMLTPTALPGSEQSDLEDLPFLLADPIFSPVAAPRLEIHWIEQLETWTLLLLAIGLLLAAWFI